MTQLKRLERLLADGRIWRMSDLVGVGIAATTVQRAVAAGVIERISRGTYRSCHVSSPDNAHLAEAVARVPSGIVCLFSAAQLHGLGDETTPAVWLGIRNNHRRSQLRWPPVEWVQWRGEASFEEGIEVQCISGITVRVTNPARTVIDMLRMPGAVNEGQAFACVRDYFESGRPIGDLFRLMDVFGLRRRFGVTLRACAVTAGAL
jgi:predicted transcriptional regulator of viral defense system